MPTLPVGIDARGATVGAAEFRRATSSITKAGAGATSMLARLGGAISVTFMLRGMIKNIAKGEKALAQLRAGLKSTAGGSGQTEESLIALSNEMQRTTTYADDLVQSASAVMLSFTKISGDVFPRAMKAAGDVAARMGTDLQGAVVQLAKALNDPITNLSAMSRAGIQFTQVQKELIKELWEGGRTAEAQTVILEELETQYGGSAAAARDTLGGALKDLANSWSDFQEELGKGFAPELTTSIRWLSSLLSDLSGGLETFSFGILAIYEDLSFAGRGIAIAMQQAWRALEVSILSGAEVAISTLVKLVHAKEEFLGGEPSPFYLNLLESAIDAKRAVEEVSDEYIKQPEYVDQLVRSQADYKQSIDNLKTAYRELKLERATPEEVEEPPSKPPKTPEEVLAAENAIADARDAAFAKEVDADRKATEQMLANRQAFDRQRMASAQSWTSYLVQMTAEGAKQSRKMFEINKAASIANIIMFTASGIQRAWQDLPTWAAIPMTAVIAAGGLAQLNAVKATTFGGGGGSIAGGGGGGAGGGGGPPGGGGTTASTGGGGGGRDVNITIVGDQISTQQVRDLMERISEEGDDGMKMRVNE